VRLVAVFLGWLSRARVRGGEGRGGEVSWGRKVKVEVVVVERMEEMEQAGIDKVWLAAGAVGTWVPSGGGSRVEWSGFGHAWVVDVWVWVWAWVGVDATPGCSTVGRQTRQPPRERYQAGIDGQLCYVVGTSCLPQGLRRARRIRSSWLCELSACDSDIVWGQRQ
jgi:hypothetical protein